MTNRRAILLVHGFGEFEPEHYSNMLARKLRTLDHHRYREIVRHKMDGLDCLRLVPYPDADKTPQVDIFEAYWLKKAAMPQPGGPVPRLLMATSVVWYWMASVWWIVALRYNRTVIAALLLTFALVMIWYATVAFALFKLIVDSWPADFGVEWLRSSHANIRAWMLPWNGIIALAGIGVAFTQIDNVIAISRFVRGYFGRSPMLEPEISQIVQDRLEVIYAAREGDAPLYDRVVVVGHSLGAVIALEALADFSNTAVQSRTRLVTWGGALPLLRFRSPRLARRIERAVGGTVRDWHDYYSNRDWLSCELPALNAGERNMSRSLRFSSWWGLSRSAHEQYFESDEATEPLLS